MITKYLCNITGFSIIAKFGLVSYLLTELIYLLTSIPLPVYNFVCFTSILLFYAFDYTGIGLGLDLGLTVSRSR